jgi:hypothetical protein
VHPNNPTSPRRLTAAKRRVQVMEDKLLGASERQIAEKLGVTSRGCMKSSARNCSAIAGLSCTSRARFVSALEEAFHPRQKRPGRLPFPAFPSSQSAGVHANPSSFLRKAQARALARTNCSASGGCRRPAAGCSPKGWPPPCRH